MLKSWSWFNHQGVSLKKRPKTRLHQLIRRQSSASDRLLKCPHLQPMDKLRRLSNLLSAQKYIQKISAFDAASNFICTASEHIPKQLKPTNASFDIRPPWRPNRQCLSCQPCAGRNRLGFLVRRRHSPCNASSEHIQQARRTLLRLSCRSSRGI